MRPVRLVDLSDAERANLERRVLGKTIISASGCHEWLGALRGGYARIGFRGRNSSASRVIWTSKNGEIPQNLFVCHKCDNPSCINIEHLFLGTREENMADMVRKRRSGRRHRMKITAADARFIQGSNAPIKILAEQFGLRKDTISKIRNRKCWKYAGDMP